MTDAEAAPAAEQPPQQASADTPAAGGAATAQAGAAAEAQQQGQEQEQEQEQRKRALEDPGETISIKVTFGKQAVTTTRPLLSTVAELKADIAQHTGVPVENQKLLFKGQLKDEQTLQAAGLKSGSKIIVMGSKPDEIKVTALGPAGAASGGGQGDWDDKAPSEPWSEQEQHKKVLGKGRPDDGWPGIKDKQVPLRDDQTYIPGLLNSQGTRVRLTFKPEVQQLWVGSAVSTQKVPYNTVAKIESQPIRGQEEYSIVRIQVGASAHSSLWLYFVPSQSVSGIKLRVLGVGALL